LRESARVRAVRFAQTLAPTLSRKREREFGYMNRCSPAFSPPRIT
jgi:hypothetical protein